MYARTAKIRFLRNWPIGRPPHLILAGETVKAELHTPPHGVGGWSGWEWSSAPGITCAVEDRPDLVEELEAIPARAKF